MDINPRIIAVDTGNKLMKTSHFIFDASLSGPAKYAPAIETDTLIYDGFYYTISSKRSPHMQNKTSDNRYFLLTLIAIAKELLIGKEAGTKTIQETIILALGLPPAHLSKMAKAYGSYFSNEGKAILFNYNGCDFLISVADVKVYPQGIAAAVEVMSTLASYPQAFVIDIGGYTTDVISLSNGHFDTSFCETFEYGVIHLFNQLNRKLYNSLMLQLNDIQIEAVLAGTTVLSGNATKDAEIRRIVIEETRKYAKALVHSLEENHVELANSIPLFIGGGAKLLKPYLEECENINSPMIIEDVRANAQGFEHLAAFQLSKEKDKS